MHTLVKGKLLLVHKLHGRWEIKQVWGERTKQTVCKMKMGGFFVIRTGYSEGRAVDS